MAAWKFFLAIAVILQTRSSIAEKVSEVECTKDAADQCTQTPNAECNNDDNTPKCQCSNGYEENSNDGSTCVLKKVSEVDCTKDAEDQCTQTPNAECNNDDNTPKCQCSNGYEEDSNDGSTCVLKRVSEVDCTKDAADQCTQTPNAECNNAATGAKCQCSNGYKEVSTDGRTCVPKRVSEEECTKDATDQCTQTPNAECNNAENAAKCQCSNGYKEDSNDGSTCVSIIGSGCTGTGTGTCPADTNTACVKDKCACTDGYGEKDNVCKLTVIHTDCSTGGNECDTIDNAECDEATDKCKCSPNFVMNVDKCVPENAGASAAVGAMTLVLSVFTAIKVTLR